MEHLKKLFTVLLVVSMVIAYMPKNTVAQDEKAKATVTKHEPGSLLTAGKDLPQEKGGGNKLLWAALGVALVGGIVAAVGGGGGGGGGGDGDGDDTGSFEATW